jgi:hypothetical protein
MPIRSILGVLAIFPLLLTACGSASGGGGTGASTSEGTCDTDSRAQAYATGLSATSMDGTIKMSFVNASPSPPAKGLNTWTLQLTSSTQVTASMISLQPFMPDHGHGPSVTPTVTPMATQGMFSVSDIDLFMPGIWANTFTITPASGPAETLVFTFCVDG